MYTLETQTEDCPYGETCNFEKVGGGVYRCTTCRNEQEITY